MHTLRRTIGLLSSLRSNIDDERASKQLLIETPEFEEIDVALRGSLVTDVKTLNGQVVQLEALYGISDISGIPPHLEIDLLSDCNLRCTMCHQSKMKMAQSRLGDAELDALIDRFPEIDSVMIAGLGEPLLHKRIGEILPYLARYQCRSHLFTNGMLIDKRLDVLGHLTRVSVSFDGDNRKTFETLRVRSDFRKILENVRLLRKLSPGLELATSTVISRANVSEITGIVTLCADLGFNEIHLSAVNHTPSLQLRHEDIPIFYEQREEARSIAKSLGVGLASSVRDCDFSPRPSQLVSDIIEADVIEIGDIAGDDALEAVDLIRIVTPNPDLADMGFIHQLDEASEVEELSVRRDALERRLAELRSLYTTGPMAPKVPECTAPWMYGFARSNGKARLCPFAEIDVGLNADVYKNGYNSPSLSATREKFAESDTHFSICDGCEDAHRKFRVDELKNAQMIEVTRRRAESEPETLTAQS